MLIPVNINEFTVFTLKDKFDHVANRAFIGSSFFQPILIDGRGHLLGRLSSIVAKTILQGE